LERLGSDWIGPGDGVGFGCVASGFGGQVFAGFSEE